MRAVVAAPALLLGLCQCSYADTGDGNSGLSFGTYLKQLGSSGSVVFSSGCEMSNGHRGEMLFQQSHTDGAYFELDGDKTIRTEQITIRDGGFVLKTKTGTRFIGKGDEAIKDLIMSPYFMLTPYQLDAILRVNPSRKCDE